MSNFCALPTYGLIISKRITLYSTILSHFYEDSIVLGFSSIALGPGDTLGDESVDIHGEEQGWYGFVFDLGVSL